MLGLPQICLTLISFPEYWAEHRGLAWHLSFKLGALVRLAVIINMRTLKEEQFMDRRESTSENRTGMP